MMICAKHSGKYNGPNLNEALTNNFFQRFLGSKLLIIHDVVDNLVIVS